MKTLADRLLSARELVDCDFADDPSPRQRDKRPGTASKFYRKFANIVAEAARNGILELLVVLYARVSTGKQERKGNLDHQLPYLNDAVQRIGRKYGVNIKVVGEFDEGDVCGSRLWPSGRPELMKAVKLAKKHDAVLVALNTSRFVRNKDYWRHGTLPTVADFEDLMGLVGKVQLATILSPDHHEDRGSDTKRGQRYKRRKGGRRKNRTAGYKKRRHDEKKGLVLFLHGRGWSIRRIAAKGMVSVPKSTVADWIKRSVG